MLKLVITGNECIIHEAMSTIANWEEYDIGMVGPCRNGMETYDMIMDETPDVVLTDIRMPGVGGLELTRKISGTDLSVQFIILSDYGELEYIREAIKSGVKCYLLKPCNGLQIINCIKQCKRNCYQQKLMERIVSDHFMAINSINHSIILNITNNSVCQNRDLPGIIRSYESCTDFKFIIYRLYYVYFLPFEHPEEFLNGLGLYYSQNTSSVIIHGVCINSTLPLFFKNLATNYQNLERFIYQGYYPGQAVAPETESTLYSSPERLLIMALKKMRRSEMIYYINSFHLLHTCNCNTYTNELEQLYQSILDRQPGSMQKLTVLIKDIDGITFLKRAASNLFMKPALNSPHLSSTWLTELLVRIESRQCLTDLKSPAIDWMENTVGEPDSGQFVNTVIQQIFDYISRNLQGGNLILRYISENYLFMNVDYVSKKSLREADIRFSIYLADIRIGTTKQLLVSRGLDKMQNVAQEVGLGGNPQYFFRLFEKKTGMAPSIYTTRVLGRPCK